MLVSLCFFLSGAAALILQVLWTRMLGHVFGATALAVSTTLTAFMGGLALGAYFGGKIAPRLKRPLHVFAALEIAVGLYGLIVPGLLELMPAVQRVIGGDLDLGFVGYSLLRFMVVVLFLLLPTTAMGATLPILAEGVVQKNQEMASKVGGLYAANTAGAVAGTALGGFVLIPSLGLDTTVYIAAAIDLAVAGVVLAISRVAGVRALTESRMTKSADAILAEIEPIEVSDASGSAPVVAVVAFALSGAAAMALEVLWTRAVGVVIGASTYAFTLILLTFLVGLTAGAAAVTRYVDRIARPVLWLARIQVAVGVLAAISSLLIDRLPLWVHAKAIEHDATIEGLYLTNFAVAAVVMLPATLALGGVMPLVIRILAPSGAEHAGPIVGRAYVYNTVGAIVGSFAGGFILLPWLGVQGGLTLACAVSIGVGALLAFTRKPRANPTLIAAALGLAVMLALPKWDVTSWTAGLFRVYLSRSVFADGWEPSGDLIYHRDGVATTVTVERATDGEGVWLKVNGKVDASDRGDMPTQVLSGLLPMMLHPDPKEVLVIGYGSGVTPGAALKAPVDRVTLVEIEEAVYVAANRFFAHVNHHPPDDARFEAVIDDGRSYLLTRDERWDVIISEPSNPWMSGASSLFTQDFFSIAKSRLDDDGVFLQWLQLYELSPDNIHALLRTFASAFEHVLVFTPSPSSNDTLLLGSRRPLTLDRARIAALIADPITGAELARGEVTHPEDLIGLFMVGKRQLLPLIGKGPLNTDDNALIEFAAPRDLLTYSVQDAQLPFVEAVSGDRLEALPQHFTGFDLDDPTILATVADRLIRQGRLDDASAFVERGKTQLTLTTATVAVARLDRAAALLARLEEPLSESVVVDTPDTRGDELYAKAAWALVQDRDRDALDMLDREDGFEKRSSGHRYLYAYLCYREDRMLDADYLIDGVLEDEVFTGQYPEVHYYAARIYFDRSKYRVAIDHLDRYLDAKHAGRTPGP